MTAITDAYENLKVIYGADTEEAINSEVLKLKAHFKASKMNDYQFRMVAITTLCAKLQSKIDARELNAYIKQE
jgi:hypothetical protein